MSLKDYQARVDDWAKQFETPYWSQLEIMCRMTEELGELSRVTNRLYGPKKAKTPEEERQNLGSEMSDILMTLICYANKENIDLDKEWEKLMGKLYGRDNDRFKKRDIPDRRTKGSE